MGTHTEWEGCKAEDLQAGDRVRWTAEGVVESPPQDDWNASLRVGDRLWAPSAPLLNAGKLERQVRPPKTGDVITWGNGEIHFEVIHAFTYAGGDYLTLASPQRLTPIVQRLKDLDALRIVKDAPDAP